MIEDINLPEDGLDLAAYVCRNLSQVQVDSTEVSVTVETEDEFDKLKEAAERASVLSASVPRRLTLRLQANNVDGLFFQNFELILAAKRRLHTPPDRFYILDGLDYLHPEEKEKIPESVALYLDAARLATLFRRHSDYEHEKPDGELNLVFIRGGKVEIKCTYGVQDLRHIREEINWLTDFLESEGLQYEERHLLLKSALEEKYGNGTIVALSDMFKDFFELVCRIKENYSVFVSDFSFRKIKNEVERQKLTFIREFNSVFSGVQNQLLAVPAGLVLAGSQLEYGQSVSKNLVVFFGYLVFSGLMSLLVRNQTETIKSIKTQVEKEWEQIYLEHPDIKDRFEPDYEELKVRFKSQRRLIKAVDSLVAFSLIVVSLLTYFVVR